MTPDLSYLPTGSALGITSGTASGIGGGRAPDRRAGLFRGPLASPRAGPRTGPRTRRGRRRLTTLTGLLAALVLLGGCGTSLLPKPPPPPTRFTLDNAAAAPSPAPAAAAGSPAASAPVLVVAVPRAASGFDSQRMVYLRQAQQLDSYALHEWVDTPARMLAPLLVNALQASGGFGAVLLAPTAGIGTWRLETELIRLQQDFTVQPSRVRLTLRAVLVDSGTRQVIASRDFDESVAAATDDPAGGAAAAHQATQRVLAALAAFCAAQPRR